MTPLRTDITILLDRSGSMESVKADTIGGFNRFLADQQAIPGEATLTLVQFDTVGYDVSGPWSLAQTAPLTPASFLPRGGTPLIDAMHRVITDTGARLKSLPPHARPGAVVLVIITDGEENSSHKHTREEVFGMLTHQQTKYGWHVLYLGANQDAIQEAAKIGIVQDYAVTYTGQNTMRAYTATSEKVGNLRAGGGASAAMFNSADRAALIEDDDDKKGGTP